MWSIICEFFQQSLNEHQKCWFKHVHWFNQISYNYQCYRAFFLFTVKKNCGGVLLTDEMELEKIHLTISQWFLKHLCKLCWQRCCCKDYDSDDCTHHNQHDNNDQRYAFALLTQLLHCLNLQINYLLKIPAKFSVSLTGIFKSADPDCGSHQDYQCVDDQIPEVSQRHSHQDAEVTQQCLNFIEWSDDQEQQLSLKENQAESLVQSGDVHNQRESSLTDHEAVQKALWWKDCCLSQIHLHHHWQVLQDSEHQHTLCQKSQTAVQEWKNSNVIHHQNFIVKEFRQCQDKLSLLISHQWQSRAHFQTQEHALQVQLFHLAAWEDFSQWRHKEDQSVLNNTDRHSCWHVSIIFASVNSRN